MVSTGPVDLGSHTAITPLPVMTSVRLDKQGLRRFLRDHTLQQDCQDLSRLGADEMGRVGGREKR